MVLTSPHGEWGQRGVDWEELPSKRAHESTNDHPTKYWRLTPYWLQIPPDLVARCRTLYSDDRGKGVQVRYGRIEGKSEPIHVLWIGEFFGFDPSGPTIDTRDSMRAACVHDAGYQLIRHGLADPGSRAAWDAWLRRLMREDAQSTGHGWRKVFPWRHRWFRRNVRAPLWWAALRVGGASAARPPG